MLKHHLFLGGFMGSGKSTIGRLLAGDLAVPFVDLDERIEEAEKESIHQIFERYGEAHFRQAEARRLRSILRLAPSVIALGGGTVSAESNRKLILKSGLIIWLRIDCETAWQRCRQQSNRPLALNRKDFSLLFAKRQDTYAGSDLTVDVEGQTPEQISRTIQTALTAGIMKSLHLDDQGRRVR